MPLTTNDLKAIRQIVREEIALHLTNNDVVAPTAYIEALHNIDPTCWNSVGFFRVYSGSRSYEITRGMGVKVKGFGKKTAANPQGSAQDGWVVTDIQRRGDDVNVTVKYGGRGVERTVKSDRIVYKRPKAVAA